MGKRSRDKNVSTIPSSVDTSESRPVLTRISPIGVREDGRMYCVSDMGHLLAVAKLPYLGLSSVQRNMKLPDSPVCEFVETELAGGNQTMAAFMENLDDRCAEAGRKCEHAFKRMKEKGLYADKVSVLRNLIAARLPVNLGWPMDTVLDMQLGMTGFEDWDADIPDFIWLGAIELSVYMLHRSSYMNEMDTTQWGLFVSQDCEYIWMLVYLTAYGHALYLDMQDAREEIGKTDLRVEQLLTLTRYLDEAQAEIRSLRVESDKRAEITNRELDELRTDNGRLVRENTRLRAKLELMEASISVAEEEAAQDFELDDTDVLVDSDEKYAFPLPETNILFVGGHVRLQNKLKQMHPKWKFVTTRMSYSLLDDNLKCDFVFFYTGHMSHKLFDKVRDVLGSTPMAYMTSQNIGLLHDEMLRAYNDYRSEQTLPEY